MSQKTLWSNMKTCWPLRTTRPCPQRSVFRVSWRSARSQCPGFWLVGLAPAKSLCVRGWRQDLQSCTHSLGMCVLCVLAAFSPCSYNHLRKENISLWEAGVSPADRRLRGFTTGERGRGGWRGLWAEYREYFRVSYRTETRPWPFTPPLAAGYFLFGRKRLKIIWEKQQHRS